MTLLEVFESHGLLTGRNVLAEEDMRANKIYAHYGLDENLRYSVTSIDEDKQVADELTAESLLSFVKQQELTPYKYWIAIYDPEIVDAQNIPDVLETVSLEEWLLTKFGSDQNIEGIA